jgi:hypothetical protein
MSRRVSSEVYGADEKLPTASNIISARGELFAMLAGMLASPSSAGGVAFAGAKQWAGKARCERIRMAKRDHEVAVWTCFTVRRDADRMSAFGTKRTWRDVRLMSAFGVKRT